MANFPLLWSALWPFSGPTPSCPHLFLCSGDQNWMWCSRWGLASAECGNDFSISAGDALVDATQHPFGFFLPWQHPGHSHWACCPAGRPELLELLLSWVDPTLCYTLDTFPRFKTSHLLNFMRFLLAHSYKGLPAGLLSQSVLFPPSLVSSVGFLRAH